MTTPARRIATCLRCGFREDQLRHYQTCVPTRYWPQALRDRKARAMGILAEIATCCDRPVAEHPYFITSGERAGWHFATVEQRLPTFDRVKPRSLYEYRQQHPEANPVIGENTTRIEQRKNLNGDMVDVEVTVSLREALGHATCPRCHRPMVVPSMHLDCKPRVMSGAGWWNAIPEAPEPPTDEAELADFLDPGAAIRAQLEAEQRAEQEARSEFDVLRETFDEMNDAAVIVSEQQMQATLDALVASEPSATVAEGPAGWPCPICGRVSKSAIGDRSHQAAHARAGA